MLHYQKDLNVEASYDVVVAGCGASGVCAAVAAARRGCKVAVIERFGAVGGNLTLGGVGPMMGEVAKGTMRDEVGGLLRVAQNNMHATNGHVHDMQTAKRVLIDFLNDAGVFVYLQTTVVDVIKEGQALTGLVIAQHSGISVIQGKVFVDATGDGDVATYAGP